MTQTYLSQLHALLDMHFDREELGLLCFHLEIDEENLPGQTKTAFAMNLIKHVARQNRLDELMHHASQFRPLIPWPELPADIQSPDLSSPQQLPISNPFGRSGRIQSPSYYLVRQPITDQIIHELEKRVSVSLVGESQTGKSSLLWHIVQRGPEILPDYGHIIYLSLELIHSDDDLFDYICSELDMVSQRGFRLARALKGQRVLLCLDEIEKMTWDGFTINVRTELRGLADGADAPFTLLLASRSSLGRIFPDSLEMTSPLAGLCTQITMPNFTLGETRALADQYLHTIGLSIPEAELERVWQYTNGHPHRLQQALKETFLRLFE